MLTPVTLENPVPTPLRSCAVQTPLWRCSTSGRAWWAASSLWPAAQPPPPPTATDCSRPSVRPAVGTLTTVQCLPSQCSTSGASLCSPLRWPTAQTLSGPACATPHRWSPEEPGFWLGTTDQLDPSQCSISVWKTPFRICCSPTSQTSLGQTAVAADKISCVVFSFGVELMRQAEPFRASTRL